MQEVNGEETFDTLWERKGSESMSGHSYVTSTFPHKGLPSLTIHDVDNLELSHTCVAPESSSMTIHIVRGVLALCIWRVIE